MNFFKTLFRLAPYALRKVLTGRNYSACIEITDKCNLRCAHCYHRRELKASDRNSLQDWKRNFNYLKQKGVKVAVLTGGEPTMRMDVIRLAEKYFPFIIVFTNGYQVINKDYWHRVYFSLNQLPDSIENSQERELAQAAVSAYRNDKRIVVCACLTRQNYHGPEWLQKFVDFVRDMNVAGLHIEFHLPFKEEGGELVLSKKDKKEIEKVLLAELVRQNPVLLATPGLVRAQTRDYFPFFPGKCPMRDHNYLIASDGSFKSKISKASDCDRCAYRGKYVVPISNFREWLAFKKVIYKSMFDV